MGDDALPFDFAERGVDSDELVRAERCGTAGSSLFVNPCRPSATLRRGRRPGSFACTPGERECRRCGWTWIGLPGGGARGRSPAPECAPPRPTTASCRRHAAGALNVERWGDVPAEARRNRSWRVPSLGERAQRAFGRPAFDRSRPGQAGSIAWSSRPEAPGLQRRWMRKGTGRRGRCPERGPEANCRSRLAGATTETRRNSCGVPVDAPSWTKERRKVRDVAMAGPAVRRQASEVGAEMVQRPRSGSARGVRSGCAFLP